MDAAVVQWAMSRGIDPEEALGAARVIASANPSLAGREVVEVLEAATRGCGTMIHES